MWLYKVDPAGSVDWERTFQHGIFSEAYSLDRNSDGGFALFGYAVEIQNENTALADPYLVRTDGHGLTAVQELLQIADLKAYPYPAADHVTVDAGSGWVTEYP